MSVRLFVASLDLAELSLVTCEFLLLSVVNFETSGLVDMFNVFLLHKFSEFLLSISITRTDQVDPGGTSLDKDISLKPDQRSQS